MTQNQLIARLLVAATLGAASMTAAYAQQEGAMAATSKAGTTDAAITTKVKSTLADQKQITVTTNDGVVILSGTVASTDVGTKAIQQASAVPGVKEVKSELTVASK